MRPELLLPAGSLKIMGHAYGADAVKEFDFSHTGNLDSLANRGYTGGFYRRHAPSEFQYYETRHEVNISTPLITAVSNGLLMNTLERF